jgi:molecular chaperone DnaK
MDANGILSVSAKDKLSGNKQEIQITPSSGLSQEEIDKMIKDSKQYAENDQMKREVTELKNRVEGQMVAAARSYTEFGRYLDNAEQEMVKKSIQRAMEIAPEEDSISLLKDILDQLESGAQKLTAAMFQAPRSEGRPENDKLQETDIQQLLKSALDDVKR